MGTDQCTKNYKMGKTLGTGSFATVKLATRKIDQEKFAIKIINKKNLEKEDEDALESEVTILQNVNHPNIIDLEEVFDESKSFYMVMEVCSGGELFDRIVEKEKYTEKDAATVVSSVADALAYCHKKGIVHRDLKPENLLLTSAEDDSSVKIADFGLAKLLNDETIMQTACGTPGYVAPEILESTAYDEKVDAWSLGVISYILLCGFPPFYDENNAMLFQAIKAGQYDFPSPYWDEVSQEAKDFIAKLLVVNPGDRMSCADVASDPWITQVLGTGGKEMINLDRKEMKKFNAMRKFQMAGQKIKLGVLLSKKN